MLALLNDPSKVDLWGEMAFGNLYFTRRTLLRSCERLRQFVADIIMAGKSSELRNNCQGPAHAFVRITSMLQLDIMDHEGNIFLVDDGGAKLDFLNVKLAHFKAMLKR